MNNFTLNPNEMKREINNLCKQIASDVNKPRQKFVFEMIYGMARQNSCRLADIARALKENSKLINTIDRLSTNMLMFNDEEKKQLWNSIYTNGIFDYSQKGLRPILFRNHELAAKNPPFNNLNESHYEEINKIIHNTNFIQIVAGINYYIYTQNHNEELTKDSSPLLMCLGILLINYAEYLNSINKKGIIIFEEETAKHDKMKLNYIMKILNNGNKTYNKDFFSNITGVYFRKKWTYVDDEYVTTAGLELADLTISPLRRILHPEFMLIENKLYNYPNYNRKGITIIK